MKKNILISGSNTGIGYETSKFFLKKGWKVFGHYFENNKKIKILIKNKNFISIKADFSSEKDIKFFLNKIKNYNIDALINCAGAFDFSKRYKNRIKAALKTFMINNIAPTLISELVLEKMKKNNNGKIINVSSIGVKYGSNLDNVFYGQSKSGIESLTRSLAREGSKYNILVNTVRPGITDTEFYIRTGKALNKDRINLIPLKRAAHPKEIAKFFFYLISENTYITNETLSISGGE